MRFLIETFPDLGKGENFTVKMLDESMTVCNIDAMRQEIEQLTSRYSISKERGGMGQVEWSDRLIKESDVLQIIDKHIGENK